MAEVKVAELVREPDKGDRTADVPKPTSVEMALKTYGDPSSDGNKELAGVLDSIIKELRLNPDSFPTMDEKMAAARAYNVDLAKTRLKALKDAAPKPKPAVAKKVVV